MTTIEINWLNSQQEHDENSNMASYTKQLEDAMLTPNHDNFSTEEHSVHMIKEKIKTYRDIMYRRYYHFNDTVSFILRQDRVTAADRDNIELLRKKAEEAQAAANKFSTETHTLLDKYKTYRAKVLRKRGQKRKSESNKEQTKNKKRKVDYEPTNFTRGCTAIYKNNDAIPDTIWINVVSYLELEDIYTCRSVCKTVLEACHAVPERWNLDENYITYGYYGITSKWLRRVLMFCIYDGAMSDMIRKQATKLYCEMKNILIHSEHLILKSAKHKNIVKMNNLLFCELLKIVDEIPDMTLKMCKESTRVMLADLATANNGGVLDTVEIVEILEEVDTMDNIVDIEEIENDEIKDQYKEQSSQKPYIRLFDKIKHVHYQYNAMPNRKSILLVSEMLELLSPESIKGYLHALAPLKNFTGQVHILLTGSSSDPFYYYPNASTYHIYVQSSQFYTEKTADNYDSGLNRDIVNNLRRGIVNHKNNDVNISVYNMQESAYSNNFYFMEPLKELDYTLAFKMTKSE